MTPADIDRVFGRGRLRMVTGDHVEVFREASWNVGLRMALYESSYLNLGVNNGPLIFAAMNDRVRLLVFKLVTPSVPYFCIRACNSDRRIAWESSRVGAPPPRRRGTQNSPCGWGYSSCTRYSSEFSA